MVSLRDGLSGPVFSCCTTAHVDCQIHLRLPMAADGREAARLTRKSLLTLQEGVSEAQFREMQAAQVQLVVPKGLVKAFPKSVQPQLQTLSQFISEVRGLA